MFFFLLRPQVLVRTKKKKKKKRGVLRKGTEGGGVLPAGKDIPAHNLTLSRIYGGGGRKKNRIGVRGQTCSWVLVLFVSQIVTGVQRGKKKGN